MLILYLIMEGKRNLKNFIKKLLTSKKESAKLSAERINGSKYSFKRYIYVRLITLTQFIIRAPFKLVKKISVLRCPFCFSVKLKRRLNE